MTPELTESLLASVATVDADQEFANLIEYATRELKATGTVDIELLARAHPHHATRLRDLLPAMQAIAGWGNAAVAGETLDHPASSIGHPASSNGVLGDFRILREIGRGGMGVVYEAEQISIGRRVALKVLPFAAMLDRQQLNRFKNEARAAGTLDHPNIVAIHSVGVERSVHFYAMQLIEGQSLAQVVEQLRHESGRAVEQKNGRGIEQSAIRNPKSEIPNIQHQSDTEPVARASTLPDFDSREYYRAIAQLGIQAAEALDHAHENGILHRDIKPANLLVDDTGKLWITDFGLARMEQDAGMTMTGDILGTLRYMSPEQALAKRVVVDHRSDIYSLGVTLYELLTLRPAYEGDDRQDLLRKIAFEDPRSLRQINAHIPADLETVVMKAVEKNPADRYATAQQLADDFCAFLENRPVSARRLSLAQRARKFVRRHRPAVLASAAALAVVLTVCAAVLVIGFQRERDRRQAAQQHLALAQEAVDEMLTKVATTWVPDTISNSVMQAQFLNRALAIYEQLAAAPAEGNPRSLNAAAAHERIADIHTYQWRYAAANDALQTAIRICRELAAQGAAGAAPYEQLVRCYRKLASNLDDESRTEEAITTLDLGAAEAKRLIDARMSTRQMRREYAQLLYKRAEMFAAAGQLAEANDLLKQVEGSVVWKTDIERDGSPIDTLVWGLRMANLRITLLRRQDRLDEAAAMVQEGVTGMNQIGPAFADAKQVLEVMADLHENQAEVLLAQGKLDEAIRSFRQALGLRARRLGGRTSSQLRLYAYDEDVRASSLYFEPLAIAEYCDTQLRLAALLPAAGRPYEAECILGDALLMAEHIHENASNSPQCAVLHANAVIAAAERLAATQRNDEAEHHFQLAAAVWKEARDKSTEAAKFRSGLHGELRDWEWFREMYPDLAGLNLTQESLNRLYWKTAFWSQTQGRALYQNGSWLTASRHLGKAVERRDPPLASDLLQLSMAFSQLGQAGNAKTEYDRAVDRIRQISTPDPELESLRRMAALLLAESPSSQTK
jgi:serine/threonine protein kinase